MAKKNTKTTKDPEFLYRNRFNTTLLPNQKNKFNSWVKEESTKQGRDIAMDLGAYDVQGYWKEYISNGINPNDADNHGPDKYKKPNHPTFSTESKYHKEDDDRYYGGKWSDDGGFTPSKQLTSKYDKEYYDRTFGMEPNRPEHLKKYSNINERLVNDMKVANSNLSIKQLNKWKNSSQYPKFSSEKKSTIDQLLMEKAGSPPIQDISLQKSAGGILADVATGAGTGALAGTLGGPIGAGAGAIIGGAVGLVKGVVGHIGENKQKAEELSAVEDIRKDRQTQIRLDRLEPQPSYLPVAESGGFLTYSGQDHDGPQGGIPVDETGSPVSVTKKDPVALTEKNEVAWFNPEEGAPYIFSEKSGFAKTAQKYIKKYKLDKPDRLNKNDKVLDETVNTLFKNLQTAQEMYNSKNPSSVEPQKMQRGGGLVDPYRIGPPTRQEQFEEVNIIPQYGYIDHNAPVPSKGRGAMNAKNTYDYDINNFLGSPTSDIPTTTLGQIDANVQTPNATLGKPKIKSIQRAANPGSGLTSINRVDPTKTVNELDYFRKNMVSRKVSDPTFGIAPTEPNTSQLVDMPEETSMSKDSGAGSPYSPSLSSLGHILSGVGNIADYFNYKSNEPKDVRMPRFAPERVSYAANRALTTEEARNAQAINATNARNSGATAGTALANQGAANTGVSRLLGQQVSQSFETEANTNAQLRTQSNQINAQLGAQESLYNAEQDFMYNEGLRERNPLSNIPKIAASYFADNASYKRGFDALKLYAPNANITQDPNSTPLKRLIGEQPVIKYKF